mgnify:CR=1 FL=1
MKYNFISSNLFFLTLFLIIGCQTQTTSNDIRPGTPEHRGQDVFNRMACNACHSVDGSLKLGPTIKSQYGKTIRHTDGSVVIIDDQYIRESLVDPLKHIAEGYTPIMPSYKPVLKDEDIENLIAYIKALK